MSINGSTVSLLCFQNSSFARVVRSNTEYCCTPISCKPLSWFLANFDRYVKSVGSALSSRGDGFEDDVNENPTRFVKKVEASNGIGSSGFEE